MTQFDFLFVWLNVILHCQAEAYTNVICENNEGFI